VRGEIPLSFPLYERGNKKGGFAPPFWMKAYMQYKYIKDKRLAKRAGLALLKM
jgi:predicted transcriptional regulator